MTPGPPDHAGPPEFVDDLLDQLDGNPPYKIGFRRGEESVEEDVEEIVKRGGTTAELRLSDGRTVTVDSKTELEGVR